jgi:hypothetical protein
MSWIFISSMRPGRGAVDMDRTQDRTVATMNKVHMATYLTSSKRDSNVGGEIASGGLAAHHEQ